MTQDKHLQRSLNICTPFVKHTEGCKLHAYPDPATGGAPWTIGYGATGPHIKKETVWTQPQAEADLTQRLTTLYWQICQRLNRYIAPHQMAALMSFVYNLGIGNFSSSTLLKHLNAGAMEQAAQEFQRWVYANKKIMPGLQTRRRLEAQLFTTGQWQ